MDNLVHTIGMTQLAVVSLCVGYIVLAVNHYILYVKQLQQTHYTLGSLLELASILQQHLESCKGDGDSMDGFAEWLLRETKYDVHQEDDIAHPTMSLEDIMATYAEEHSPERTQESSPY